jgi:exodeoxyribonuclease VII large subunit
VRLDPAIVRRRIDEGRRTLDALWRIAAQAHPDRPLAKGYARVEDRDGHTLISAEAARSAGRLRLVFGDGKVDASVGDGVERQRRATYVKPEQPKLL